MTSSLCGLTAKEFEIAIDPMDEKLQQQITFHLTGRRDNAVLEPLSDHYRPAVFARYADLTSLRYDFPLVLNTTGAVDRALISLSETIDEVVASLDDDPSRERIARQGYQIEQEIRRRLSRNMAADLESTWNASVERLAEDDETVTVSAKRLWNELFAAGDLVDIDEQMPTRVVRHIWDVVQKRKARAFRDNAERLLFRLHKILEAEFEGSRAGRAPERLKASVGVSFSQAFDFDALSLFVNESKPAARLSDERRSRIEHLIEVLESQRFYPIGLNAPSAFKFDYESCREALEAYASRRAEAAELLKALAIAELETDGEYRDAIHDAIFDGFGSTGLDTDQLAKLPDYLITINTAMLDADERALITEVLSTGLPIKILIQCDDILERSNIDGNLAVGTVARQLVNAAIGMTSVFVLQSSASDLFRSRERLMRGLTFNGPAMVSVFSGANPHTAGLPPYLVAAAAIESRAFPTFVYDPSAGANWATRFSVDGNPSADSDWPAYGFEYEDASLQAVSETITFTLADFLAMDERYREHFAIIPKGIRHDEMISVKDALQTDVVGVPDAVPSLAFVDDQFRLRHAIVDARTLYDVRRCLNMWRSLQELGGINNSFVEKAKALGGPTVNVPPAVSPGPDVAPPISETETIISETAVLEPPEVDTDEPYIETARCTSCNECTQINNKMFAYNTDKQAYIADPNAGTFRQLVEAAEGCQVSIIHPGKPRNPKEPGLEDLIKRAVEFN